MNSSSFPLACGVCYQDSMSRCLSCCILFTAVNTVATGVSHLPMHFLCQKAKATKKEAEPLYTVAGLVVCYVNITFLTLL